jgi:hypothetical protein
MPRAEHSPVEDRVGRDSQRAWVTTPERPFNFYDRRPFPEPIGDIAGLLLAPRLAVSPLEGHLITWCLAVPSTAKEFRKLRDGHLTAIKLIEDIDDRDAWTSIMKRWQALAA